MATDSETFKQHVELVWKLQIDYITDFDEILAAAKEQYGVRLTRRELQKILEELENRIERLDEAPEELSVPEDDNPTDDK